MRLDPAAWRARLKSFHCMHGGPDFFQERAAFFTAGSQKFFVALPVGLRENI
jgi:hypothetical protein